MNLEQVAQGTEIGKAIGQFIDEHVFGESCSRQFIQIKSFEKGYESARLSMLAQDAAKSARIAGLEKSEKNEREMRHLYFGREYDLRKKVVPALESRIQKLREALALADDVTKHAEGCRWLSGMCDCNHAIFHEALAADDLLKEGGR